MLSAILFAWKKSGVCDTLLCCGVLAGDARPKQRQRQLASRMRCRLRAGVALVVLGLMWGVLFLVPFAAPWIGFGVLGLPCTLGEEFRFHDSSRFRKKAGDAKLRFYHSFVPVLMSLAAESCRSRAESVHLLKPHLQWG